MKETVVHERHYSPIVSYYSIADIKLKIVTIGTMSQK